MPDKAAALPLIATIHAARLEARFIKAMAEGRAWVTAQARLPDVEPEADPIATPHITTRADIEEVDRLRADLKAAQEENAELKAIVAAVTYWFRPKKPARSTEIPQTHETHGD